MSGVTERKSFPLFFLFVFIWENKCKQYLPRHITIWTSVIQHKMVTMSFVTLKPYSAGSHDAIYTFCHRAGRRFCSSAPRQQDLPSVLGEECLEGFQGVTVPSYAETPSQWSPHHRTDASQYWGPLGLYWVRKDKTRCLGWGREDGKKAEREGWIFPLSTEVFSLIRQCSKFQMLSISLCIKGEGAALWTLK